MRPSSLDGLRAMQPDLLVTAAYGQILSADLLSIPRLGGINLHGSVLPWYRGAAPVARAIQNGEVTTGVTVIRMTPRIDAGGILDVAETPIGPDETAGELEGRLARLGAPLVAEGDRRTRGGTRRDPAAGSVQGHQGAEAPQGGWADRLVASSPGHPQPRPCDAALAGRIDHVVLTNSPLERPDADYGSSDRDRRRPPSFRRSRRGRWRSACRRRRGGRDPHPGPPGPR